MIGFIEGVLEIIQKPFIFVNVHGVGYKILVSERTLAKLKKHQKVKIYTFTYIRDDAFDLFGFLEQEDLLLFEDLITVSGIGPKTAMNVFSFGDKAEIIEAIAKGDVSFFSSVPRLGIKNAQKIIIELRNKMGSDANLDLTGNDLKESQEVIEALKNFGFSVSEAQKAFRSVNKNGISTEEKIRLALKELGR
jgi:Holliday junction DNA helicase RuvA